MNSESFSTPVVTSQNPTPATLLGPLSAVADPVRWSARWIWIKGEGAPRNFYLAARTSFIADGATLDAPRRLHIAADTRYRIWLNGEWLGDGPARSFAMNQAFDTYDVTGLVRPGKNVLAVLVCHFGEGTFQYSPSGHAGLLVQLEQRVGQDWATEVASDETWRVRQHTGYVRPTLRISCQMPFEEIFDGRELDPEWITGAPAPGFVRARVVAAPGEGPWKNLTPCSTPPAHPNARCPRPPAQRRPRPSR